MEPLDTASKASRLGTRAPGSWNLIWKLPSDICETRSLSRTPEGPRAGMLLPNVLCIFQRTRSCAPASSAATRATEPARPAATMDRACFLNMIPPYSFEILLPVFARSFCRSVPWAINACHTCPGRLSSRQPGPLCARQWTLSEYAATSAMASCLMSVDDPFGTAGYRSPGRGPDEAEAASGNASRHPTRSWTAVAVPAPRRLGGRFTSLRYRASDRPRPSGRGPRTARRRPRRTASRRSRARPRRSSLPSDGP